MPPRLTVVVATYNRPDVLMVVLQSLIRQTVEDWIALVIGDCCDAGTGAMLGRIDDPRIRFFNLPERCGDQSGPNSIGARLCRTPYLAFLNHDDLLLPDHLERALYRLRQTDADICFGQAIGAIGWLDAEQSVPVFRRPAPVPGLSLIQTFASLPTRHYEPVSAWMMKTSGYERVGAWRDGYELFRTPLNDWLIRACRARLRACTLDHPTVVYPTSHNRFRGEGGVYRAGAAMQVAIAAEIQARGPDDFRRWAMSGAESWSLRSRLGWIGGHTPLRQAPLSVLIEAIGPALPTLLSPWACLYLGTGLDVYTPLCWLRGRQRGATKVLSLAARTREGRVPSPDRERLVEAARQALAS
jgi:hypothetical protein